MNMRDLLMRSDVIKKIAFIVGDIDEEKNEDIDDPYAEGWNDCALFLIGAIKAMDATIPIDENLP